MKLLVRLQAKKKERSKNSFNLTVPFDNNQNIFVSFKINTNVTHLCCIIAVKHNIVWLVSLAVITLTGKVGNRMKILWVVIWLE